MAKNFITYKVWQVQDPRWNKLYGHKGIFQMVREYFRVLPLLSGDNMKRRRKKDKWVRKYCGYCGKWRRMYELEFNEHQEDCEKELVLWYRESHRLYDDEEDNRDGKDSSN